MAGSFDFTNEEAVVRGRTLAPLSEVKAKAPTPWWLILFLLGLLGGLIVAAIIQRRAKKSELKAEERHSWMRLKEILVERQFSPNEAKVLAHVIRKIGTDTPDRAAISQSYFDSTIIPALELEFDSTVAEKIRAKLFNPEVAIERGPSFENTKELRNGQSMRLHFSGIDGTHSCVVINSSDSSFTVSLPMQGEHHIRPAEGSEVEGYVEIGKSLFTFKSTVRERMHGGVFACRLDHSTEMTEIRHRDSMRVPVKAPVMFGHFGAEDTSTCWKGSVIDLSMGGCALETPAEFPFDVGELVQFNMKILEDEPPQNLSGQIMHLEPLPRESGGGSRLHLQFTGLSDDARASLARTIFRISTRKG